MASSLIKIDEEIVTSAVATVELGGTNWDSSYDVYMVRYNNVQPETDLQNLNVRFTVSGTADSSSNYDYAFKKLRTDTSFNTLTATNQDKLRTSATPTGTSTSEVNNGLMYLFNFNNASEYSFITEEETMRSYTGLLIGNQGGGVLTVTGTARDGIQFFFDSGNIDSGTFTLYGLAK